MLPLLIVGIAAVGGLALAGCASVPRREHYPETPSPDDPLAQDPCSVQSQPDIVLVQSIPMNAAQQRSWIRRIAGDFGDLERINPQFLCGLTRLELMDQKEFSKVEENPDTRGHYDSQNRVIRIQQYSRKTLFHEIGHHIHNLGILAPTIRQSRALGWLPQEKGEGLPMTGFFFSEYSKKNPKEDWAETFALMSAFPLEIGMRVYYPSPLKPRDPNRLIPLQVWQQDNPQDGYNNGTLKEKADLLYAQIPFPKILSHPVKLECGDARLLPPSQLAFTLGEDLHLYDEFSRIWSRIPADPKKGEVLKDFPNFSVETGEFAQVLRVAGHIVMIDRSNYMEPSSHGSGVGILLQGPGKSKMKKVKGEDGTILGELHPRGKEAAYFTRTDEGVEYKSLDPATGRIRILAKWKMPNNFETLHVLVLENSKGFAVIGRVRDQDLLQLVRVRAQAEDPQKHVLERGGDIHLPSWRTNEQLPPLRHGERILFPFRGFQFLSYELRHNRFEILDPKIEGLPEDLSEIHGLFSHQGRLTAVGNDYKGMTLVFPITLREQN